MPARIGMVADGLWPPCPWQAAQVRALVAPRASSGPALAAPATRITPRTIIAASTHALPFIPDPSPRLTKDVVPDAGGPADGVLGDRLALGRGELLLDLHHLVAVDPVA